MRYRSNLEAPDLSAHFKLKTPPIEIMGHEIPSDPDYDPKCGFWEADEAAILYNVAKQVPGVWVDVGSRFGWTGAHLAEAGCRVLMVDPEYVINERFGRMAENMKPWIHRVIHAAKRGLNPQISATLANALDMGTWRGAVIDGNHDAPEPTNDVKSVFGNMSNDAVIMLHDFWGKPIRDAANWLIGLGWSCRIYWTPNGVACCWRGLSDFVPPDHVRDPQLEAAWEGIRRQCAVDFDFGRTK